MTVFVLLVSLGHQWIAIDVFNSIEQCDMRSLQIAKTIHQNDGATESKTIYCAEVKVPSLGK